MFLSIGIKYTIIIVSLVVLVMHLGTFPPTRLLSGISSVLNLVFLWLIYWFGTEETSVQLQKTKRPCKLCTVVSEVSSFMGNPGCILFQFIFLLKTPK